jgi:hypothetical protein
MNAEVSLPADDTNLATSFTYQQYLDVETNNEVRVEQCSTGGYAIQLFKIKGSNDTNYINISWEGQSSRSTATSKVVLQIFDRNGTVWETLVEENETGANTDFTLNASITSDLDHYYDANFWIAIRVWQQGI